MRRTPRARLHKRWNAVQNIIYISRIAPRRCPDKKNTCGLKVFACCGDREYCDRGGGCLFPEQLVGVCVRPHYSVFLYGGKRWEEEGRPDAEAPLPLGLEHMAHHESSAHNVLYFERLFWKWKE